MPANAMRVVRVVIFLVLVPGIMSTSNPDYPKEETIDGPSAACPTGKSDVLFVVDASSSISVEKFDSMRSFIVKIIETENVKLGRDNTQVGLVMFSDDVVANIPFNKYYDIKEFNEALTNLTYVRGETNLGIALRYVRTKALTPENGLRPTFPHVVILMTDGWATDGVLARAEMKLLKKTGVTTLIVAIGQSVDKAGLKALVNSPDDVVMVDTWKGLPDKVPNLRKKSCQEIQKIQRCNTTYKANVIFIVDSSTSIGEENFKVLKSFLVNVTRSFKVIGKDGIQVGMVQYSSYSKTKAIFYLDTHNDRESLEAAINGLEWTKGSTKTGYAMVMADKWMFQGAYRKNVNSTFIVVTDGKANDRVEVAAARLHKNHYTVLAVGIGNEETVDGKELNTIASEPKEVHVFNPKDFNELAHFLKYVVTSVCNTDIVKSKQQLEEKAAENSAD
ncbi:collagen alpha-1(XII) chain-like [Lineus longissimus]|uniref:collagen alpha-1(XII) chain-like n=1 Tax=Lineus longissimus TaxID=88925 RepID=UPI002B4E7B18